MVCSACPAVTDIVVVLSIPSALSATVSTRSVPDFSAVTHEAPGVTVHSAGEVSTVIVKGSLPALWKVHAASLRYTYCFSDGSLEQPLITKAVPQRTIISFDKMFFIVQY